VRLELAGNGGAYNEAVRLERALAAPSRRAAMLAHLQRVERDEADAKAWRLVST
jgi:hypothetical protein